MSVEFARSDVAVVSYSSRSSALTSEARQRGRRAIQRSASYGLVLASDRVHMVRLGSSSKDDHGRWMLPGGRLEHGEHPRETVVQEFKEGTGSDAAARYTAPVPGAVTNPHLRRVDETSALVLASAAGGHLRASAGYDAERTAETTAHRRRARR
ncbi:NUDIX domain-containing protein [Nocardia sp. CS682]|uniref:NUDIX hydrolase n=1 Tax=Nocardia sp. CS682 TaxID=1047172 RepID=UPI00107511AE